MLSGDQSATWHRALVAVVMIGLTSAATLRMNVDASVRSVSHEADPVRIQRFSHPVSRNDRREPLPGAAKSRAQERRVAFDTDGSPFAISQHSAVDASLWLERRAGSLPGTRIDITPLPRLDGGQGWTSELRRTWRRLVVRSNEFDTISGNAVADVRCMGLSAQAVTRRAAPYDALIIELSIKHAVSASLVKAIIATESCFDPSAVSPVGAVGLMQLMPATAKWLNAGDPSRIDNNLRAGVRYFASLRESFGDTELALAAYNAGPGNVRRYGGVPPFRETRDYIVKVMASHRRFATASALAAK